MEEHCDILGDPSGSDYLLPHLVGTLCPFVWWPCMHRPHPPCIVVWWWWKFTFWRGADPSLPYYSDPIIILGDDERPGEADPRSSTGSGEQEGEWTCLTLLISQPSVRLIPSFPSLIRDIPIPDIFIPLEPISCLLVSHGRIYCTLLLSSPWVMWGVWERREWCGRHSAALPQSPRTGMMRRSPKHPVTWQVLCLPVGHCRQAFQWAFP